ncbi:MAG TPA: cellulase family glycosylhydrolase [Polyangiaceae bacterium]
MIHASDAAADTLLADFEVSSAISRWVFSNGPEFPGAKGQLDTSIGHRGNGARLAYDLTAGGNYVSATLTFDVPITTDRMAFWVKEPARSQAKVRLYDSSGQALEYSIQRPLEAYDPSQWFRIVIDVNRSTGHFGGRNDGVVHPPLTGISILAIPEFESVGSATGTIEFDELMALSEQRVQLDPKTLPLVPAPAGAAELAPRFAVNVHTANDERGLDIARAAGFSTVRLDLGWSDIETKTGTYDFSRFDALVQSLKTRGMRLHLILDYLNKLYPSADSSDFISTTVPAFVAMARATAQHLRGQGVSYEIWNEPNSSTFWTRSEGDYATLCAAASAAVHAGDPDAKVCTGGVSGFDYKYVAAYLAAGGGANADAIGVHPYRAGGGETVGHDLLLMRAVIGGALGSVPPVWDTEWGYSSTWWGDGHAVEPRVRQAQMVARELLSAWALGFPLVVYYDLRDGGTDSMNAEQNYGLVQNDYTDKPAMIAVRALSRIATGRRYAGLFQTGLSSLHGLRIDGASDTVAALWWDDPNQDVVVELSSALSGSDLLGKSIDLQPSAAPKLTLRESDGPVYLTFGNPPGSAGAAGSSNSSAPAGSGGTSQLGSASSSGGIGGTAADTRTTSGTSTMSGFGGVGATTRMTELAGGSYSGGSAGSTSSSNGGSNISSNGSIVQPLANATGGGGLAAASRAVGGSDSNPNSAGMSTHSGEGQLGSNDFAPDATDACSCRVLGARRTGPPLFALGFIGVAWLGSARRRVRRMLDDRARSSHRGQTNATRSGLPA